MRISRSICITGVAGFVGSNLSEALLARGYQVVGLDNLSMGSLANLVDVLGHPNFRFIKGDVTDAETVLEAAKGCEVIVHLAAFKIPRYGGLLDTLKVNEAGGANVLEAARQVGARVVLASTSDVYGRSPELPFREDGPTVLGSSTSSRWGYAVSKLFDEHLSFGYHQQYGTLTTIIRIFGSYGPHQHLSWWGGPQSVFISAILKGEPVEIHGDGMQTRSFCFISDLVRGFVAAIERVPPECEIINLGNAHEINILELARLIKRLSGTPDELEVKFHPYSEFKNNYEDVRRRVPDLSKALRLLGYRPEVSLEEGLTRTIAWQRIQLGMANELLEPALGGGQLEDGHGVGGGNGLAPGVLAGLQASAGPNGLPNGVGANGHIAGMGSNGQSHDAQVRAQVGGKSEGPRPTGSEAEESIAIRRSSPPAPSSEAIALAVPAR